MTATLPTKIEGRAYVLGDNIDTDQIIPAEYLNLVPTIPQEYERLGSYALSGLPDGAPSFVEAGRMKSAYRVIVAGRNFGCGSSREHAPIALAAAGTLAVVAESYARIFFRNAVATGELYPLECPARLCDVVRTGDAVALDVARGEFAHAASGRTFALAPLGDALPVIQAGGLFNFARRTGMIKGPPCERE